MQRAERRAARDQDREPRAVTEFGYLAGVRDDLRQGAVRLRDDDGTWLADEKSGVPVLAALPELLALAARGEDGEASLAELRHLVHAGSSLGGARPKAHLRDVGGRLSIAKFPSARHDAWVVAPHGVDGVGAVRPVEVPRQQRVDQAACRSATTSAMTSTAGRRSAWARLRRGREHRTSKRPRAQVVVATHGLDERQR